MSYAPAFPLGSPLDARWLASQQPHAFAPFQFGQHSFAPSYPQFPIFQPQPQRGVLYPQSNWNRQAPSPFFLPPPSQVNSNLGPFLHASVAPPQGLQGLQGHFGLGPASFLPQPSAFAPGTLVGPWPGIRRSRRNPLVNPDRTQNVYVRLLPPLASDATLFELGSRFAPVVSVRALLNPLPLPFQAPKIYDSMGREYPRPSPLAYGAQVPLCRGVGFVLYHSIEDAEKAILGLNELGFDASFAKLPIIDFDEESLANIFHPAVVQSVRLLCHPENGDGTPGLSRGIGFARLESRAEADAAIKRLRDSVVPGGHLPLKIRFADSRSQRDLKATLPGRTSPLIRRQHQQHFESLSLSGLSRHGLITPPATPKRNKTRSAPSSQYSTEGTSNTSGSPSPRRHPSSSKTSIQSYRTKSTSTSHSLSPPSKKATNFAPSSMRRSSDPCIVFPPTPPQSPIRSAQRPSYDSFPFITPPRTPTGLRGSPSSRKSPSPPSRKVKVVRSPPSRTHPVSAGPLRTRFHIPDDTLFDIDELESACGSLEADVISSETLAASKRMTGPRKSLP
ncbi:hypothetical protein RQP46_008574 [Phenoliferia psychrophenolica]